MFVFFHSFSSSYYRLFPKKSPILSEIFLKSIPIWNQVSILHNEMESLAADCQKSAGCIPDFKARFPAGLEKELFSAFCSRINFVTIEKT